MREVAIHRRNGKLAKVRIDVSRDHPGHLHVSCPNMWVLSEGQVIDLIEALEKWRESLWGESQGDR